MKKVDRSVLGPFVHWFFPKLSPLVPIWMTANAISLLGFLTTVLFAAALLLSAWSAWMYVLGALMILGNWVTDTMDGIVARSRGQTSIAGDYIDHFGDCLSAVLVGVSLFATEGSHVEIGLVCATIYLLILNHVHIKSRLSDVMELPRIGPSEIRCIVAGILLGQVLFDRGRPLAWLPAVTGDNAWLVRLLGLRGGLTFTDVCGLIAIAVVSLGIWPQIVGTLRELRALDRAKSELRAAGQGPPSR